MNLRIIAFAIIALNLGNMPVALADKGHHHHHFMSKEDMNLLMYGSHEAIAEGYSQKCDENHKLKERIKQLQNEHWQPKLIAKGMGIGVVLLLSAEAIAWIATR